MNKIYSRGHYFPNFWLKVAKNSVKPQYFASLALVFGLSAYGQEKKPDTTRKLTDTVFQLEEVTINTGYQKVSAERLTGSYEKIDSATFNRKVGLDVLSRLKDNSSILFDNRNRTPNLQVRGLSTLTEAISQPLIILDNFPYEGDVNLLNPNDVADVVILKDAAAASIWGAKAGNGVIVITTKKAKKNQALRIEGTMNVSTIQQPDLFSLPVLPSGALIELQTDLFNKGAYKSYLTNSRKPALVPVVEILNNRKTGLISAEDSASQMQALYQNDVRHDFEKYIYRTAVNQQYQVGISSGSEKGSNRFSLGYDKDLANLVGNDNQRITLMNSNQLQLTHRLSFETMLQYQYSLNHNNSLGDYGADAYNLRNTLSWQLPTYARLADDQGNTLAIDRYRRGYIDTVGQGQLLDWNFRPLDELRNNDHQIAQHAVLMDAGLNYQIITGLVASAQLRYQRSTTDDNDLHNEKSYFARDLINRMTNLKATTEADRFPVPRAGILERSDEDEESYHLRGQLSFQRTHHQDHWISVLAGAEMNQTRTWSHSSTTYGYDGHLNSSSVDFTTRFPVITGGTSVIPDGVSFSDYMDRYVSFYGNASYAYKKRYTIYTSGRNDATNLFGVNQRNKWKPLWSAGAGYTLSDEPFYKLAMLPLLKLRVSYGFQGNVNNAYSAYTTIGYSPATDNTPINVPYATVSRPGNPELRWEKVRQLNTAVDFSLKNKWLSGSLDFYRKWSSDVIFLQVMDPTSGYGSMQRNSANLYGQGMELTLVSTPVSTPYYKWNTQLRVNTSHYKVTRILLNSTNDGYVSSGKTLTPLQGYNPYMIISYQWAGLDPSNGNPLGYLNGQVSSNWDSIVYYSPLNQQVFHGSALPTTYGNWLNTFQFKSLNLSFNIGYKFGYYLRKSSVNYLNLFANGPIHADYLRRWQQPGDEVFTQIPSIIYPNPSSSRDAFYESSTINVIKGDHIRLQDVRVSYLYKQVQFYTYLSNLNMIIWRSNKADIDPDYPSGLKPGLQFSLGCTITFN